MSTPYTIAINGAAAVSSQSLGLSFGGLELANMAPDSASLKWTRRRASEACPIAHDDTVEIYRGTTRLFHGKARLGTVTNEGCPIKVIGPWTHLEKQQFQMSRMQGTIGSYEGPILGDVFVENYDAGDSVWNGSGYTVLAAPLTVTWTVGTRTNWAYPSTTGTLDVNMGWTSRFWLFTPGGTAGQIYTTIQDEVTRLMNWMAHTNDPDLFDVGVIELGAVLAPKFKTVADTPCSDILRSILAMKPDAAVWWDYAGTGLPDLRIRVASLEVAIPLTIGVRTGQALSNYALNVADELVPSGVVVRWERDASQTTGMGRPYAADIYPGQHVLNGVSVTNTSTTLDCDSTAGVVAGRPITGTHIPSGAIVSSVTNSTRLVLSAAATGTAANQQAVVHDPDGVASYAPGVLVHTVDEEVTPVRGVAQEIYGSLAVRRARGSLTVIDHDFSMGLRPGLVIQLTGDPQLTDVQIWVQSVSWSAETGLASLTVGYPAHLQLRDRIDLRGWLKKSLGGLVPWIVPA